MDQTPEDAAGQARAHVVGAGTLLAFFAFTGFENLANMAEEAKNAPRTIPRAILLSLGISTAVYIMVALVVLAAMPVDEAAAAAAPLLSAAASTSPSHLGGRISRTCLDDGATV